MTTSVKIPNTGYIDIYQELNIPVGTKLLIQNQGPAEIQISTHTVADTDGLVTPPFSFRIIPAGSLGCFIRATTNSGGLVAVEIGGWSTIGAPTDERVYNGLKAFTVQPFIEANVKNGTQWELSFENNNVASGASVDIIKTTGSKHVLVKNRILHFTGSELDVAVYKNTIFTGGTTVPIYNLNTQIGGTPLTTVKTAATVTSVGTEVAARVHAYGTDTNVNQAVGSFNVSGIERVLAPNTTYMLRMTNQAATAVKISGYITFYEGEISSLN